MEVVRLEQKVIDDDPGIVQEIADLFLDVRPEIAQFHTDEQMRAYDHDTSADEIRRAALSNGAREFSYGDGDASAYIYFVKDDEGQVVGAMRALTFDQVEEGKTWRNSLIDVIAVNQEYRGCHIGQDLAREFETEAFGRLNRQTLFALVHKNNGPSNDFFNKLGYRVIEHPDPKISPELGDFHLYKKGE